MHWKMGRGWSDYKSPSRRIVVDPMRPWCTSNGVYREDKSTLISKALLRKRITSIIWIGSSSSRKRSWWFTRAMSWEAPGKLVDLWCRQLSKAGRIKTPFSCLPSVDAKAQNRSPDDRFKWLGNIEARTAACHLDSQVLLTHHHQEVQLSFATVCRQSKPAYATS